MDHFAGMRSAQLQREQDAADNAANDRDEDRRRMARIEQGLAILAGALGVELPTEPPSPVMSMEDALAALRKHFTENL